MQSKVKCMTGIGREQFMESVCLFENGNPLVEHMVGMNRDPKVVWVEEMILDDISNMVKKVMIKIES